MPVDKKPATDKTGKHAGRRYSRSFTLSPADYESHSDAYWLKINTNAVRQDAVNHGWHPTDDVVQVDTVTSDTAVKLVYSVAVVRAGETTAPVKVDQKVSK
jgi:hypothetical protein